jgi:hypothetical protein
LLPVLMVYMWVELALRRSDQQGLQDEAHSNSHGGNRSLAFVAILARHAERFFAWYGSEQAGQDGMVRPAHALRSRS